MSLAGAVFVISFGEGSRQVHFACSTPPGVDRRQLAIAILGGAWQLVTNPHEVAELVGLPAEELDGDLIRRWAMGKGTTDSGSS